jgi:hypothetical protein
MTGRSGTNDRGELGQRIVAVDSVHHAEGGSHWALTEHACELGQPGLVCLSQHARRFQVSHQCCDSHGFTSPEPGLPARLHQECAWPMYPISVD